MSLELFGWDRCAHDGIGLPGCRTCDPDKGRVFARYEWIIERHRSRLALAESLLSQIAYHAHCSYERRWPDMPSSASDRNYEIGVTDGHRCAADLARTWFEPKQFGKDQLAP